MRPAIITSVAAASNSIKSFGMVEGQRRKTTGDWFPWKCCWVFESLKEDRIFRKMQQDCELIGCRKLLDMNIITCAPVCTATEWFDPKQKHIHPHFPFAYVQLSPPAKDSRGAEWVKSKQLMTLSEASHPAPASPCSGFYAVGSTCPPPPSLKLPLNTPRTPSTPPQPSLFSSRSL